MGRPLTRLASDTQVRILDGAVEIARHPRSYDRHEPLLDPAFAQGESAGSQTAQLVKLLDLYGPAALGRAIREALERNTPRASSVAFLLRRGAPWAQRSAPPRVAVDLSRHPEAQSIDVRPHDLETYDALAHSRNDDQPDR